MQCALGGVVVGGGLEGEGELLAGLVGVVEAELAEAGEVVGVGELGAAGVGGGCAVEGLIAGVNELGEDGGGAVGLAEFFEGEGLVEGSGLLDADAGVEAADAAAARGAGGWGGGGGIGGFGPGAAGGGGVAEGQVGDADPVVDLRVAGGDVAGGFLQAGGNFEGGLEVGEGSGVIFRGHVLAAKG